MALTRDDVVSWLATHAALDPAAVADDTKLFSTSLVDSFVMVDLLLFLEERIGAQIPVSEVNLDNLDTVGSILAFCAKRRA